MKMTHPTASIIGTINRYLSGRCIIIGVTGSVSAYKSIDLARWLIRRGARILFVASKAALDFLGKDILYWASGEPPLTELSGEVEHIEITGECDGMIIAPATLNTLSKLANGVGDTPVTLTAISMLGENKRIVAVPAMHSNMMKTRQFREAKEKLENDGVLFIPSLVEGEVAKYPPIETVGRAAAAFISRGKDLEGRRILVTAGATREWLDPVRFISNPSSGRMGMETALEAWARGAEVILVHGHVEVPLPHMVEKIPVTGTYEMCRTVREIVSTRKIDYFISTAAPVDFKPSTVEATKIKSGRRLSLTLIPTPKVIEVALGKVSKIVSFAAETMPDRKDLIRSALEKMNRYSADIMVANDVSSKSAGFASEKLDAVLIWKTGERIVIEDLGKINKEILARRIIDTLTIIDG